jgi:DNA-binding transcriptional regulator/RsmH inhibitor MraZ
LGFKATYYHGGLTSREKDKNMQLWMDDKPRLLLPQMHLEWALTKQMSRPLFTTSRKYRKLLSRSRSIWQKWRKSICGTSNESF